MRIEAAVFLILPILILTSAIFNLDSYAVEERKVFSRSYVGLGVEVCAPYQSYADDTVTIRVRVEALEDVENTSVSTFIWGSKSEGGSPWSTSFTVLDIADFYKGMTKDEKYNVTIPSDIDPGLTYGILYLEWSIYRSSSWEEQWDKASFRVTYVRNRDYENLQDNYKRLDIELQNSKVIEYIFLATTIALVVSTAYLAKKRRK